MIRIYAAVLLLGTLTASGQNPAAPKPTPPPNPAVAKPVAPAPAPATTAQVAATSISVEQVKDLTSAYTSYQLDQLELQTAQSNFTRTDPVAKRAMQILRDSTLAAPEVVKAQAQADTDRKALVAKIDALRKQQHLDDTYDWDFTQNRFVQTKPEPGAKPTGK